jgi:hypothetical protein
MDSKVTSILKRAGRILKFCCGILIQYLIVPNISIPTQLIEQDDIWYPHFLSRLSRDAKWLLYPSPACYLAGGETCGNFFAMYMVNTVTYGNLLLRWFSNKMV